MISRRSLELLSTRNSGIPAIDSNDNIYGTTGGCGSSNLGIVWKLSKKGIEKVLHSFTGGTLDGAQPEAGVILAANGNLYGDTQTGGTSNIGNGVQGEQDWQADRVAQFR